MSERAVTFITWGAAIVLSFVVWAVVALALVFMWSAA